jgi:hypothetical protein
MLCITNQECVQTCRKKRNFSFIIFQKKDQEKRFSFNQEKKKKFPRFFQEEKKGRKFWKQKGKEKKCGKLKESIEKKNDVKVDLKVSEEAIKTLKSLSSFLLSHYKNKVHRTLNDDIDHRLSPSHPRSRIKEWVSLWEPPNLEISDSSWWICRVSIQRTLES